MTLILSGFLILITLPLLQVVKNYLKGVANGETSLKGLAAATAFLVLSFISLVGATLAMVLLTAGAIIEFASPQLQFKLVLEGINTLLHLSVLGAALLGERDRVRSLIPITQNTAWMLLIFKLSPAPKYISIKLICAISFTITSMIILGS